jgi:signal transduction histidine kinase
VLFGSASSPPDRALLDLLASVGLQIGDFLARKRAEETGGQQTRLAEIGALTAKIVHDIGNPLAGLSMLASRIERRLAREPDAPLATIAEPVGQLDATVRRLVSLIQGFKNFSREQRLELEEIALQSFLADLVDSWRPEAAERSISLVLQRPDERTAIFADAVKLRRVLDNLVKNALEAVDHGPGQVRIAAKASETARVQITVEDTGPGVPRDLKLFELFSTTKPQGTGLGLAIARQIIQAHGGGIELAQVEPHGASFQIELPRRI